MEKPPTLDTEIVMDPPLEKTFKDDLHKDWELPFKRSTKEDIAQMLDIFEVNVDLSQIISEPVQGCQTSPGARPSLIPPAGVCKSPCIDCPPSPWVPLQAATAPTGPVVHSASRTDYLPAPADLPRPAATSQG